MNIYQNILELTDLAFVRLEAIRDDAENIIDAKLLEYNEAFEAEFIANDTSYEKLSEILPFFPIEIYQDLLKTQKKHHSNYQNRTTLEFYNVRFVALSTEHFALLFVNTTLQHSKEAQISETDQQLIDIIDKNLTPILLIDDGKFVYCNEATIQLLGYNSREELFMTHPSELSPEYQPDGKKSFDKVKEMNAIAFRDGYHRFEWMHRTKQGEEIPIEVSLTFIPFQGKTVLYCHWKDLRAEKATSEKIRRQQQQLQAFIDAPTCYIIRTNTTGQYTFVNNKYVQDFGWVYNAEHYKDFFRKPFVDTIPKDQQNDILTTIHQCIESPGEVYLTEIQTFNQANEKLTTLWNFVALTDADGHPEEIQCIGIDISTRKEKEAALLKKQEEILLSMSTPITQLWDDILLLPLVGNIDEQRAQKMMNMTLQNISTTQAKVFILDIGGVQVVDTNTANYFIRLAKSVRLMGCHCILSGISAAVAQTMIELGVDIGTIQTTGTLKTALQMAMKQTMAVL